MLRMKALLLSGIIWLGFWSTSVGAFPRTVLVENFTNWG